MSGLTERPSSATDRDKPLRYVPFQQNRGPTGIVRHREKKAAIACQHTLRQDQRTNFEGSSYRGKGEYNAPTSCCTLQKNLGGSQQWSSLPYPEEIESLEPIRSWPNKRQYYGVTLVLVRHP